MQKDEARRHFREESAKKMRNFLATVCKYSTKDFDLMHFSRDRKEQSSKVKRIEAVLEKWAPQMGGTTLMLSELMSELLGEKVATTTKMGLEYLTMVVPTKNTNGHDYTLGEAVLHVPAYGKDVCIRSGGSHGNHIGVAVDQLRPATEEEIDAFFEKVPVNIVDYLMKDYVSD